MPALQPPRVLAITPARGGSRGVPHKNIHPLLGQPLIAYTIAEARKSRFITRYLVSTDDPQIQRIARLHGAEAPFLRPAELATDEAPVLDVLQHAMVWAEADEGQRYDYVIELKCTNPLKTVDDIDGALAKLIETGADAVIGMVQVLDAHPARVKASSRIASSTSVCRNRRSRAAMICARRRTFGTFPSARSAGTSSWCRACAGERRTAGRGSCRRSGWSTSTLP